MDKTTAQRLVSETFKAAFDKKLYRDFINELCNGFDEGKAQNMGVPDAFTPHVKSCQRLGTFESADGELADVLIVHLTESYKLERTRTALRDFVAHKLKRDESYKEAGLVAFVAPDSQSWRFSFVRMEYETKRDPKSGKIKPEERLTPARRYSYIVGVDEECHTAQSRFLALLQDTTGKPTLSQIEEAFSVESVTKEFFAQYAALFASTKGSLDAIVKKDAVLRADFAAKNVSTVDFAKKLLGQIVFLYFIQKKGWLGVPKGGKWGDGPRNFLRKLADTAIHEKKCLFNDVLEPLFYDTLATDRGHEAWCETFVCRIPFLNGGLFEPLAGYDWKKTNISFANSLFTNRERTPSGDIGSGILDVFDRYNFTVSEAEPLEKEVAIDPEMLGKVFENLIEENRRKGLGAFYTPREIVHYMCQESLINYLDNGLNHPDETSSGQPIDMPRKELEDWIRQSDQFAHYAAAINAGTRGEHYPKPPESISKFAQALDGLLRDITVCDPAIGSGAFPVGMMTEIVRARMALTPYLNDTAERTAYHLKRHVIQSSIHGVDIDAGAVEIAKLRLWLSLVVDEDDVQKIKPLPNLDFKIVVGNSLLVFPFQSQRLLKVEKLKAEFFDETDHHKKVQMRSEIGVELAKAFAASKVSLGYQVSFDFELYFSEVFRTRGGFDVVIANPPYLESRSKEFSDSMKDQLSKALSSRWPHIKKMTNYIPRGSDLLVYFFEIAIHIIARNGVIAFITQNAWLDTEYGKKFQHFLLTKTHVALVLDSDYKYFNGVGSPNINTVITLFLGKRPLIGGYATFARINRPFAPGVVVSSGRHIASLSENVRYRQYQIDDRVLKDRKWGILLSLEDVVLDLLSILQMKAKILGGSDAPNYTVGQGLNLSKSYIVSSDQMDEIGIPRSALISILTASDGAPFVVKNTNKYLVDSKKVDSAQTAAIVDAGIDIDKTTASIKKSPLLIMPRGVGRHFCAYNDTNALSSSFVEIGYRNNHPDDNDVMSLWAMMNSSVVWLLREASGRKNLGGGMLKAEAVDIKNIPLFVQLHAKNNIQSIKETLTNREAKSPLEEMETTEHKEIDKIVFDGLGLKQMKRQQVLDALKRKIEERLVKSRG